ncbi:MAG: DNA repair protein RecO [Candidatus Melainabacteria bacterium RIFOXYA12_FULL_32_12]|nr:MAG: DNA repair protein RecO [Candidatus Melainabacteria bacterium RIFOXYA2_FULL_32_9]OGI26147.1 MAG: DNA repair protein RecO [Candidatus Melainabacteria bacterium RIFOXYA12_FULL_32_12]
MANYTTQAINLKSYNLGEADKIMVMYSRDHGIIRCVAKGIKKPTSKLGGRMETLNANKLFIAKGKKLDIVCQAELVDTFKEIRKDITKLTYAIYCAELINTFGLENDSNSAQIYDIFFETLKNISLSSNTEDILWTVIRFKLRLMKQLGYAVELNNCVRCNNQIQENSFYFSAESGGVVCNDCKNEMYKTSDLDSNIIRILKDAINFDFPEVLTNNADILDDKIAINQLTLDYSFKLLKEYISIRSDKKLKTPELIECLC